MYITMYMCYGHHIRSDWTPLWTISDYYYLLSDTPSLLLSASNTAIKDLCQFESDITCFAMVFYNEFMTFLLSWRGVSTL